MRRLLLVPALLLPAASFAANAPAPSGPTISIEEFEPKSTLRVPEHKPTRAKFPFIDVHTHHREVTPARLEQLIKDMDSLNMGLMINSPVSRGQGKWVADAAATITAHSPARFRVMTNIDDSNLEPPPPARAPPLNSRPTSRRAPSDSRSGKTSV
jgi:hypothetical protein